MKALGYRILIKPDDVEKVSKGGIIVVTNEQREAAKVDTGTIVDIGPSAWDEIDKKGWAKVGDRILFSRYSCKYIQDPVTGERIGVLNDDDALCLIEEKEED